MLNLQVSEIHRSAILRYHLYQFRVAWFIHPRGMLIIFDVDWQSRSEHNLSHVTHTVINTVFDFPEREQLLKPKIIVVNRLAQFVI
jgi:hypothetical protein